MEYRQWHDHYDYEVPTSLRFPRILVHDILQISANAHPNKPATICNGKSLTFWELRQLVLRMANALKKLGVEKGDRVGLHLPTCPQYVIANHAILSLGAIVVNLNPIYPAEELAVIVRQTEISTLITIDKALANVRSLCRDFNIARVIVVSQDDFFGHARGVPQPPGWMKAGIIFQKLSISVRIPTGFAWKSTRKTLLSSSSRAGQRGSPRVPF